MQSMDEIYKQFAKTVYKFLMARTCNCDLAEELTQETFFQAIRSIDKYDYSCSISTWLCAIAKTKYLEYIRKHPAYEDIYELDSKLPEASSTETVWLQNMGRMEILQKLHSLPEPFREVIYLRIFGNLSFSEIGKIMEKNENWARVNFYRGKERLRKELDYEK